MTLHDKLLRREKRDFINRTKNYKEIFGMIILAVSATMAVTGVVLVIFTLMVGIGI